MASASRPHLIIRRVVPADLSGLAEALLKFLARVSPYEQGDEGTHGGAVEPCGHLFQALVDRVRVKPAVELLMDEVRDIMQIRVD